MSWRPGDRGAARPTGRRQSPQRPTTLAAGTVLLALALAGCGGGGGSDTLPAGGVHLEMRHSEPLKARGPVRWTLVVHNGTAEPKVLQFSSGQDGDVVLRQAGQERYRWSAGRAFTQALRRVSVPPRGSSTFILDGGRLDVAPGEYEAVASLAASDAPAEVRQTVTVTR